MQKNYFLALTYSVLATFCLVIGTLHAQTNRFAIQASGGISGIVEPNYPVEGGEVDVSSSVFSYGLAFVAEKIFRNPQFGVSIEPGFIKRGYQNNSLGATPKNVMDLYYLNAPLAIFYKPLKNDRLRVSIGTDAGYLFEERSNGEKLNPILNDLHENFDFGGFISLQSNLFSKFALGFRATRSFTPISTITFSNSAGELTIHDRYNFGLNLYARYYIQ